MQIKSIVENEDGEFTFHANLTEQQHAFLIEYAIRDLVRKGLVPFISADNELDLAKVVPVSDIKQ